MSNKTALSQALTSNLFSLFFFFEWWGWKATSVFAYTVYVLESWAFGAVFFNFWNHFVGQFLQEILGSVLYKDSYE